MNSKYHTSAIKSLSPENLEVILQVIARFGNDEELLARYFECYRLAYAAAIAADTSPLRWCPPWYPPCTPAALSPCGSAQPEPAPWTEFSAANPRPDRWKGVETAKKDQNDFNGPLPTHVYGQAEAWIRLASLCLCLMESYRPPGKNACEQIENYVRGLYAGTYGPDALARRDEEMNRPE